MREYSTNILNEIARELAFVWAAHRLHKLDGKMRLWSPKRKNYWDIHEAGFDIWFGPGEIDLALQKIDLFYKAGEDPKTPFLLDPVVYRKLAGAKPIPIGSGIIWNTCFHAGEQKPVPEDQLKRISELGVFTSPFGSKDQKNVGLKALAFLEEPTMPIDKEIPEEGSIVPGVQELADLLNVDSESPYNRYYLLSGLEYLTQDGRSYHHERFDNLFGQEAMRSFTDIESHQIHLSAIRDAAKCWNAYERDTTIYKRYGVDVTNLERNLQSKIESDRVVNNVSHELQLLYMANKRCGLEGEMRLYSAVTQDIWRTKEAGVEIWFDDSTESLENVANKIQYYYNAGVLPNTPLLVDPIMYKRDDGGIPTPIGTAIVWTTALSTGLELFDEHTLQRINDLGLYSGKFIRAGTDESGLKIMGFLDKAYMFGEEDIAEYHKLQRNEAARKKLEGTIAKEREALGDNLTPDEVETFERQKHERLEALPKIVTVDALPIPGCSELFSVAQVNGEEYWPYYLCTGLEYLCSNGAYANPKMEPAIPKTDEERKQFIDKYTITMQQVQDAGKCWESYDKLHDLWMRFGVDVKNLDKNLKYYNLCGRNLDFLNMTGESRDDADDKFEFLVPGWVPRAAITIIGATGGTGKSSLAHRLAILTSSDWSKDDPNPKWLGSEIDKKDCEGISIYFSGEDSAAIVNARAKMMDPEGRSKRLLLKCASEFGLNDDNTQKDIGDFLRDLEILPQVDCVVIDPARKYLIGDEDDSEVVSQFFEAIEQFAIKKNCGMVVVHHLVKEAAPKDTRDIYNMLRGSQVFIDRARVVIGLMREGEKTIAGLAKNNIPPKLGMVEGERLFVRDPARLDLFWLPGEEGVRTFEVTEAELEQMKAEREAEEEAEREEEDDTIQQEEASSTSQPEPIEETKDASTQAEPEHTKPVKEEEDTKTQEGTPSISEESTESLIPKQHDADEQDLTLQDVLAHHVEPGSEWQEE